MCIYLDPVSMYMTCTCGLRCVNMCVWIRCRWSSGIQRPLLKCQSSLSLEKHRRPSLIFFCLAFSHTPPCPPHSGQRNGLLLFSLSKPLYLWLVYCSFLTFRTKENAVRRELIMFLRVPTYLCLLNIKCFDCPLILFHVYRIYMSTSFSI